MLEHFYLVILLHWDGKGKTPNGDGVGMGTNLVGMEANFVPTSLSKKGASWYMQRQYQQLRDPKTVLNNGKKQKQLHKFRLPVDHIRSLNGHSIKQNLIDQNDTLDKHATSLAIFTNTNPNACNNCC